MRGRMLVTGASGMLGDAAMRYFAGVWEVVACMRTPALAPTGVRALGADLGREDLDGLPANLEPDVVLNCAAVTAAAACQADPEAAHAVNALLPQRLAARFPRALLVHVSTDAVFAPSVHMAKEDDETGPTSVYGRTKLEGELLLRTVRARFCVVRTTLVGFAHQAGRKRHLADWIVTAAMAGQTLGLYTDALFTPISIWDFLEGLKRLMDLPGLPPTLHLAGKERVSKYDFGSGLLRGLGFSADLARPTLRGPDPTARLDQSLDSSGYARLVGTEPPGLDVCLRTLICHKGDFYAQP